MRKTFKFMPTAISFAVAASMVTGGVVLAQSRANDTPNAAASDASRNADMQRRSDPAYNDATTRGSTMNGTNGMNGSAGSDGTNGALSPRNDRN